MFLNEEEIDWKVLRVQKMYLLYLGEDSRLTENEKAALTGLLRFLDYIQDQGIKSGDIFKSYDEIFTHRELEKDAKSLHLPYEVVDDALFVILDPKRSPSIDGWLDAFMSFEKASESLGKLASAGIQELKIITKSEWSKIIRGYFGETDKKEP